MDFTFVEILVLVMTLLFGLVIGSFTNVLVFRIPKNESIAWPGSHCMECNHPLKWYDNIPIFSYLFLKGKCRYCGTHISIQYPIIEAISMIVYGLIFLKYRITFTTLEMCIIFTLLLALSLIDYRNMFIPDGINIAIGVVSILSIFFNNDNFKIVFWDKIASLAIVLIFICVYLFFDRVLKKEVIGFGDIKLILAIGIFLGARLLFISIFFAAVIALIVEVIIKRNKERVIPFGPFLSMGFLISFFFGNELINWYLSLFDIYYI